MTKSISILFFFLICLFISNENLQSAITKTKWEKFGVSWIISNSKAEPRFAPAAAWNYTELSNYNSIISTKSFENYNSIETSLKIFDRLKSPTEFMISFAVTSESKSWFYHIYSFKITGGYWGMNKVSFIYSDRIDKTKPLNVKNNSFVKEIASEDCSLKYDKIYNYRVAFEGTDVVLYINNEKVLSAPFPEKTYKGRVALSVKNVKISLDNVKIKKGDKTIFEDDFNEDSILTRYLKASQQSDNPEIEETQPE